MICLPCSSGPTVVIIAPKHLPRHWWTSVCEGGTVNSKVRTRDNVGSTYPRYIGPLESTIKASEWRDQVYKKTQVYFSCKEQLQYTELSMLSCYSHVNIFKHVLRQSFAVSWAGLEDVIPSLPIDVMWHHVHTLKISLQLYLFKHEMPEKQQRLKKKSSRSKCDSMILKPGLW